VPLDFIRRRRGKQEAPADSAGPSLATRQGDIAFDALTEEWRLSGTMTVTGRLSDVLNKREPIPISGVKWAPLDGSAEPSDAPGLRSVDPYDLIVVIAGESTMPPLTEAEKAAHKVHKITYDVALEAPPFRIVGTVQLYPGSEPERLLDRGTEMFVAVVDAIAYHEDRPVTGEEGATVLVNRFYLRGVEQIDRRTGERPQKLPGQPLGGVSWRERSR
jgi:hypothetical protein